MDPVDRIPFPKYLVLDGGLGTELTERCGNVYRDVLWTMRFTQTNESVVRDIQREFLDAGADVVMTNTYRPSLQSLMDTLSIGKEAATEMLINEARSTCSVRDQFWQDLKDKQSRPRPLVAAAMGPFAAMSASGSDYSGAYIDNVSVQVMADTYRGKIRAMLDGGVDILGFETIPAAKEAEAICIAMKDFPDAKGWIVFCCKDGEHVGHGETFSKAVKTSLTSDAIVGVGVNCSEPSYVTSLLKQIPEEVKKQKRIVVYPNAGKIWDREAKMWRDGADNKHLHEYVSDWLALGANWIGGCCFVPPAHIADIQREVDNCTRR